MSGEVGTQARTIINGLSAARIDQLAAELGVRVSNGTREKRASQLAGALADIAPLDCFGRLRREELRSACKMRGLGSGDGETSVTYFTGDTLTEDGQSVDDEALAIQEEAEVAEASRGFPALSKEARGVLDEMVPRVCAYPGATPGTSRP